MSTTIDYAKLAQQGQDQFLAAVKQSQQAIVDSVAAWSQTVQTYVSAAPTATELDGVPSAEEIVETTFDLVQKLVAGQREFATNLLAASAPARTAVTTPTPAKTASPEK